MLQTAGVFFKTRL